METKKKLQNIGASILWFLGLMVLLAQTYRAVAYYIFNLAMEWTWHDVVIAMVAFAVMFVPARLKTMVVETLSRITGRK